MPGTDGRGPLGEGPKTGRRLGRCANSNSGDFSLENDTHFGNGRGVNRGLGGHPRGSGRGFGHRSGGGFGYHAGIHDTEYVSNIQPDLSQQLNKVIDQLSQLLKQSSESRETNHENK